MKLLQKIGLRIILLAMIVLLSNFIYTHTTYESDLNENGNVLSKFNYGIENSEVLYFSASPNAAISGFEGYDRQSISEMVADGLPSKTITSVDTGGIHAGVFKRLISLIPKESNVETVVVHLNYRSFGMGWIHSDLENAIQKQMVFYNNYPPVVNRFLQGLNYYDVLNLEERKRIIQRSWKNDQLPLDPPKNTVDSWCKIEKWGDWTNPKRQLADHYIKNFAFTISEDNPRLQDFDEIIDICRRKNLKLIYVILPENIEESKKLLGDDLAKLMISNKEQILNRYKNKGATVIDLFNTLPDSAFIERDFPSEHYFDFGRKTIAEKIVKKLKQD